MRKARKMRKMTSLASWWVCSRPPPGCHWLMSECHSTGSHGRTGSRSTRVHTRRHAWSHSSITFMSNTKAVCVCVCACVCVCVRACVCVVGRRTGLWPHYILSAVISWSVPGWREERDRFSSIVSRTVSRCLVCVCVWVCEWMCACLRVHVHVCVWVCMHSCKWVFLHVSVGFVCVCACVRVCVLSDLCTSLCVCIGFAQILSLLDSPTDFSPLSEWRCTTVHSSQATPQCNHWDYQQNHCNLFAGLIFQFKCHRKYSSPEALCGEKFVGANFSIPETVNTCSVIWRGGP